MRRSQRGPGRGVFHSPRVPVRHCCRIWLYGIKHAARGGVCVVAEPVALLAGPAGPVPLAVRGLAAVLARAGPAGGGGQYARWQRARRLRGLVLILGVLVCIPVSGNGRRTGSTTRKNRDHPALGLHGTTPRYHVLSGVDGLAAVVIDWAGGARWSCRAAWRN